MPSEGDVLFKGRDEILAELQEGMQNAIPDVYLGEDGNLNLFFQVLAGVMESVFLANQIVSEDMFILTANETALEAWGTQFNVPRKQGTPSSGTLVFTGDGGITVPLNAQVAYDSGTGEEPLYFNTTQSGVIPNPGTPTKPALADVAGSLPAGTYEYGISFLTIAGETEMGEPSDPLTIVANRNITVTLPVGGIGTTGRRIYRALNGGDFLLAATVSNNTATSVTDSNTGTLIGSPLEESTAERITLNAESDDNGEIYNVLPGTVTVISDAPDGVIAVTNTVAFIGGSDREAQEDFRTRLLDTIKAPVSGSLTDIQNWAQEVEGVETATAYENDNLGVATNGHYTVRISGPNNTQPPQSVIDEVQARLVALDTINATPHTASFTAIVTDVTVDVTVLSGFTLLDVTPTVQAAISSYITNLAIGETLKVSGIVVSVFGLPGISDVTVTVPAANVVTAADSKRTPGTITVT